MSECKDVLVFRRYEGFWRFCFSEGGEFKLVCRPLKSEDGEALSRMLQGEIEHGIVSPYCARRRLGCPDEAGEGALPNFNSPAK